MKGRHFRKLRRGLGRTQAQLADDIGVAANTVARYERDELAIPEPVARLLKRLADQPLPPRRTTK
jgi:transcriptional regulator with XRE-family HTH domain